MLTVSKKSPCLKTIAKPNYSRNSTLLPYRIYHKGVVCDASISERLYHDLSLSKSSRFSALNEMAPQSWAKVLRIRFMLRIIFSNRHDMISIPSTLAEIGPGMFRSILINVSYV